MLSQKEAVYDAVKSVLESKGRYLEDGVSVALSKDEREDVVVAVTSGIISGSVTFKATARKVHDTPEKIKKYVSNMVGNWLSKDTRLNGGEKHTIKNPGSRGTHGDEVVKNLKILLKNTTDADKVSAINQAIESRLQEVSASKPSKTIKVDYDKISPSLLSKLNITI